MLPLILPRTASPGPQAGGFSRGTAVAHAGTRGWLPGPDGSARRSGKLRGGSGNRA